MKITKHIPNLITCLNLFCGILACIAALRGDATTTFGLLVLAALFDFCDGLMARLLNAYSPMGKELDSLADLISFGLAPGFLTFSLLQHITAASSHSLVTAYVPYIAFMIPVFSALRLAKFNIDDRQTNSFIGMPTPANAMFWVSFALSVSISAHMVSYKNVFIVGFVNDWYRWIGSGPHWSIIAVLVILFSLLLVSEISMFSLKFKSMKWSDNQSTYLFMILSAVLIVLFGAFGITLVIASYILFSLFTHLYTNKQPK